MREIERDASVLAWLLGRSGGLSQVLCGELGEFSDGVLADDLASFGVFGQAVYEFEADTLLIDAYVLLGIELTVGHLAEAVAYSRLQSRLLGLDASGLVLVIRRSLASRAVGAELDMSDVLADVLEAPWRFASTEEPSSDQGSVEQRNRDRSLLCWVHSDLNLSVAEIFGGLRLEPQPDR